MTLVPRSQVWKMGVLRVGRVGFQGGREAIDSGATWYAVSPTTTGSFHTNPLCPNIIPALVKRRAREAKSLVGLAELIGRSTTPYRWCVRCAEGWDK